MYSSVLINIKVPNNNSVSVIDIDPMIEEIKENILYSNNSEIYTHDDIININLYKINTENLPYFEGYLDTLRHTNKGLRYSIQMFEPSKKYPSSIRINKKGNKIFTKLQTKILLL
tara:strand:+ start:9856 stop:10200 length:345 start_codon:yes stop_codon:yes gene_type:complete